MHRINCLHPNQHTPLRTIHGTMLRLEFRRSPARKCCAERSVLNGPRAKSQQASRGMYHTHKDNIKREQGQPSPFFKTHISAENPSWMHIRELELDMYQVQGKEKPNTSVRTGTRLQRQMQLKAAMLLAAMNRQLGFAKQEWKVPLKHPRSMPHGNRTPPVRCATWYKAGLSMQENRTARHKAMIRGPHNRIRTNAEFVRASVKQGVKRLEMTCCARIIALYNIFTAIENNASVVFYVTPQRFSQYHTLEPSSPVE